MLLDAGVNGAAYDDHLLTPLDHLARRVCMSMSCPSHVVDTIRALVERGRCQPLTPVTSNAVAFYKGPEEGFAWLFATEYTGADLEELDSEGWTLLGDAALRFGQWTELCIDDPSISWQSLYLLRSGVNPHARSSKGRFTPLDSFLRGCTAQHVEHAGKWLQMLSQAGIDLHKYATEENNSHQPEHILGASWDEELWRWIPVKHRVVYHFGDTPDQLQIWLDDYDALSWFRNGRFDLDIFLVCTPLETQARWKQINKLTPEEQGLCKPLDDNSGSKTSALQAVLSARWPQILILSLGLHYLLYSFLVRK